MSLVAHPQAKDCEEKPLVMDNADLQQGEHAAMGDPTEEPKAPEAEAPSKEGEATNVGCGEENRADLKIGDTKRSLSAANPEHCDIDPSAGDVPSVEAENKMAVFPPVEAEGKMVDAAKDGKARDDGEIAAPEGKAVHEIVEKEQVGDAPKTDSGDVQDYDADVQKMEKKNEHEIEAEVTEESERKKREVSRLEEREREVAELVQHAEDLEKKAIHLEQQAAILDQAADEMEREAIARQQAREGRDDSDEDLEPDSASGSPEEKRFDWDGMIADLETKLAAARDRVEESKEARNVARSKLKRWKAADLTSEAGLSEESGDSTAQASEDEDDDIPQKTTSDMATLEETAGGLKDSGEKAAGTSEDPAPTESLLRATFSEAKAKVSQAKKALTKVEHKLRKAKKEHRDPLEPQAVKRQKLDKKAESIALKQSSSKTQLHAETEDNTAASKSLDERPKEKVNKADGAEGKLIGEKQRGADKMYVRPVEGGDVKVEQSVAKVDKEREGEVDPAKRGRADGELQEHYVQEAEIKVAGKLATGDEEAEEKPEGCETTEPEEPVTSTDQDVVGAPATPPEPQTRAPEGEPIAARGPPTTSTAEMDVADSRLAPNVALLADESKGVAVEAEGDKAAGRGGRVGVEEKEGGAALVPATHADSSSSDESATTALPGAAAAVDEDEGEDEEADGPAEGPMLRLGAGPGLPLGRFPAARVVAEMAPRLGDLPAAFERVFGARDEDSSSGGSQEADGLEDRRPTAPSTSGGLAARERSGGGGRARPQFAPPPPESPASAATALTGLFAAPAKEREEEDEEAEEEPEAREQGPRRLARRWSLEGPHASPLPAPARLYSSASSNAASLPALTGPALGREADAEEEEEEEEGEGGSLGTASTLSADAKAPLAAPAAAPAPARPAAPPRSRWERWVRRVLRGLVPREPHASAVPAPAPAPAAAPPPPPQRAAAAQRSAPALALGLGAARRYPAGFYNAHQVNNGSVAIFSSHSLSSPHALHTCSHMPYPTTHAWRAIGSLERSPAGAARPAAGGADAGARGRRAAGVGARDGVGGVGGAAGRGGGRGDGGGRGAGAGRGRGRGRGAGARVAQRLLAGPHGRVPRAPARRPRRAQEGQAGQGAAAAAAAAADEGERPRARRITRRAGGHEEEVRVATASHAGPEEGGEGRAGPVQGRAGALHLLRLPRRRHLYQSPPRWISGR